MTTKQKIKWSSIDLTLSENDAGYTTLQKIPAPLGLKRVLAFEKQILSSNNTSSSTNNNNNPMDNSSISTNIKLKQQEQAIAAKQQARAMGLATSPGKSILMNAFMMYMSGSNLNMWSISIIGVSILQPLTSILTIHKQFSKLDIASSADNDSGKNKQQVDLQMPKLLFLVLNFIWLGIGLFKMSKMRLLPTTSADWSGRIVWKEMNEISSIPPL